MTSKRLSSFCIEPPVHSGACGAPGKVRRCVCQREGRTGRGRGCGSEVQCALGRRCAAAAGRAFDGATGASGLSVAAGNRRCQR